jgi:hypothetical protein
MKALKMPTLTYDEMFYFLRSSFQEVKQIDMKDVWSFLGREFGVRIEEAYEMGKKLLRYFSETGIINEKLIKAPEKSRIHFYSMG